MIRRALDWLANAKSVNDAISSDALCITALELVLANTRIELRQAQIKSMVWQTKAEDLQDKLEVASIRREIENG